MHDVALYCAGESNDERKLHTDLHAILMWKKHIDISNNHAGHGILKWIERFDPLQKMTRLIARNTYLHDNDVVRLAHSLCHSHIRRIDLRGNSKLATRGIAALVELVNANRAPPKY